jgi:hypothetical protein
MVNFVRRTMSGNGWYQQFSAAAHRAAAPHNEAARHLFPDPVPRTSQRAG